METKDQLLEEVSAIRQLLELIGRDAIKSELNALATTPERREIWSMCDGLTSTNELAEKTGLSTRAVQLFVSELQKRDLVTVPRRGYPKRRFDYVPSDWDVEEVMRRA